MRHVKFNKIGILVALAGSLITTIASAKCTEYSECLRQCPQIVLKNAKVQGSEKQCQESWKFFTETNEYDILSIMTISGLGGQKVGSAKALDYAKKALTVRPDAGSLVESIESMIGKHKVEKLAYCEVFQEVTPDQQLCQSSAYDDNLNALRLKNNKMAEILAPAEAKALEGTLDSYLAFLELDNKFRYEIGQFQGSGRGQWATNSRYIMIEFYEGAIKNLLDHYPASLKTKQSEQALKIELNNVSTKLDALVRKIPPGSEKGKDPLAQQLARVQESWILFRDAYVHFAQLHYANKYTPDNIKSIATAYITSRRIKELNDQHATVRTNLAGKRYNKGQW